jgi:hypothetical protein
MNLMLRFAIPALLSCGLVPAQGQNPLHEIQEIANRVDEQLREIDRLLLQSAKPAGTEQHPRELLQRSQEQSQGVEQGIDELIRKLNEMKNQSRSSQDQDQQQQRDQQQQQQQQQQQGERRNRQDGSTPDFMPQPQPQPGQDQQQPQQDPPQGNEPQGGEQNPDGGQNRPADRQPDQQTGPGQPGQGEGEWGALQPYLNELKNRGSPPRVPEKFRKYWEAYVRSRQEKK